MPEREPAQIDSIRWSSRRCTHVLPASVNVPEPLPVTCKVTLITGETIKARGTTRDLHAQLALATRPAWQAWLDATRTWVYSWAVTFRHGGQKKC